MISLFADGRPGSGDEFLKRLANQDISSLLNRFGAQGVTALAASTPTRTGETANSWSYKVERKRRGWTVAWYNSNVVDGSAVAVLIQYGHATGTGGYVPGIDYINPAMSPIFESVIAEVWREVTK